VVVNGIGFQPLNVLRDTPSRVICLKGKPVKSFSARDYNVLALLVVPAKRPSQF